MLSTSYHFENSTAQENFVRKVRAFKEEQRLSEEDVEISMHELDVCVVILVQDDWREYVIHHFIQCMYENKPTMFAI